MTGSITGVVIDSRTKVPVQGATVSLQPVGKSTVTGKDGTYAFYDLKVLAENKYDVQVMADGYETDTKSIRVNPGEDNRLDFSLSPSVPVLEVTQTTIDFDKSSTTQTIDVRNTGYADLLWEISEDIPWLSCTPSYGTVRSGSKSSIIFTVDRGTLKEGTYSETVSIVSSNGGGSADIRVTVHVEGMSVMASPSELDFGETTTSLPLTLESNREAKYYLEPSNSWIIPSKDEGLFTGTEHLTVAVDRTQVSAGKYEGKLILKVGAATKEIPVRMSKPSKQAPLVALYSVSDISYGSAVFTGAVVSIGSSKVTRCGFCWSEDQEPDIDKWFSCDFGDLQSAADLPSYQASDLKPSTKYHVCAYAENSDGLSYSEVVEFTTQALPSAPSVETGTISKITHESVSVTGNVLSVGNDTGVTEHGHVWSTSSSPTTDNLKTTLGKKDKAGVFTSELSGLSPNTTYHVRAYAVNSIGTAYGEEKTFITLPDEMKISTSSAENITHNSATLGGYITYDGGNVVSERGVCWAEHKNPTIDDDHKPSTDQGERFSVRVQTLTVQTAYWCRAYVIAETGKIYYGNDVFFNTTHEILPPKTAASSITDIDTDMAVVSSSVVDDGRGNVSEAGFVYSKSINPTIDDFKVSCGAQKGDFSTVLYDLEDNTTYYVRSYAVNEAGPGYGEETFFTTLELKVPDLSATEVTKVTYNSASFSADVLSLNNGTLKEAGFVYSTSPDPDINSTRISCMPVDMHMSTTATSLAANTLYYVRAYAVNEKGTAYGATESFTTREAPQQPVMKTGTAVEINHDSAVISGEIVKTGVEEGVTQYGHVWSMSPDPTVSDFKTDKGAATEAGAFSSRLEGLLPNTTYHIRAYAVNSLGTAYGEDIVITTLHDVIRLETIEARDKTHNAVTFGGRVTYYGGNAVKEYGVCWSESATPVVSGSHKTASVDGDEFSVRVEGLEENTEYHYRAYAVSEHGDVYYGDEKTVTTPYEIFLPEVSDVEVVSFTHRSANLAAEVLSLNHGTMLDAGFVYSTSPEPDLDDNIVRYTDGGTHLTGKATPLEPLTTYYVKAFVKNEKGIVYSAQKSFTTLEKAEGSDFDMGGFDDDENDWN